MRFARRRGPRWTLADLIDFEVLLAAGSNDPARDRLVFARDIRPRLAGLDAPRRRRAGLAAWLAHRRGEPGAGAAWRRGIALLRLAALAAMAVAGAGLVFGLCSGLQPRVHVVVFVLVTLLLPWGVFVLWLLASAAGAGSRAALGGLLSRALALAQRFGSPSAGRDFDWQGRLLDSAAPRRALAAALSRSLQWAAVGFNLGMILAFVGSLLVFDVRFYWAATPQTAPWLTPTVAAMASPWRPLWPAAAPDAADIAATRAGASAAQAPANRGAANAAWWRFLLMALLVWGLLPRLALVGWFAWRERAILSRLDFQAPRHRQLWRELAAVERGAVADQDSDAALLLDVGGAGIRGEQVRGFLLRRLRVNPTADHRIGVLDDAAEAAADAALAAEPAHVVLAVEDWGLSPRQATALHQRVRELVGRATPLTWLVLGRDGAGEFGPPEPAHLERWTALVDSLRDPATEIVAYAPEA